MFVCVCVCVCVHARTHEHRSKTTSAHTTVSKTSFSPQPTPPFPLPPRTSRATKTEQHRPQRRQDKDTLKISLKLGRTPHAAYPWRHPGLAVQISKWGPRTLSHTRTRRSTWRWLGRLRAHCTCGRRAAVTWLRRRRMCSSRLLRLALLCGDLVRCGLVLCCSVLLSSLSLSLSPPLSLSLSLSLCVRVRVCVCVCV